MENDNLFIEQAEYISPENFIQWSSEHPNEGVIIKKLTQSGAKLITGPRGCGKTTLMLKAYNKLNKKGKAGAFPVYVNFKASLRLEPIYKSKANGSYWFSQWMYLKLYEGLYETLGHFETKGNLILKLEFTDVKKLISLLELGEISRVEKSFKGLSAYDIEDDINNAMYFAKKPRCVLLFDDAAHAFSPEQQRDFFEFFRKIKSRSISPKAAIYPGVTNFAPTFNIGHDAEEVDVWVNPEDEDYLGFMKAMLSRRLPTDVYEKLSKEESLLSIICFAAFGIPRNLLNTVRNMYHEKNINGIKKYKITFTRKNVLKEVKNNYDSTLSIYTSLEQKLPTFKNYISEGIHVYIKIIDLIKKYNSGKDVVKKGITIAIKKEIPPELKIILGFFQYAGLCSYKRQISKGEKGLFSLYIINLAALIDNNAIIAAKAYKTVDLATALEKRSAHSVTRAQPVNLLSKMKNSIELSMPPCPNCKAERTNEDARFCSNCGAPLKESSIYKNFINSDISVLPLTKLRTDRIKENSSIEVVRDILYDIGHRELQSVPQIGKYWASRIYYLAEEYIS